MTDLGWQTNGLEWNGQPLAWEARMYATYSPRCYVHPDRTGAAKTAGPDLWLVVHTSEGGETETSAEAICDLMGRPGDKPSPSGSGMYGASYHAVADTDVVRPAVPDRVVAYSAGGANSNGIHICIPGRVSQTREQWLDTNSRKHIRRVAEWLCDKAQQTGIPLIKRTATDLIAGRPGVCGHFDVSQAFKKSDHTDPEPRFPWDVLFSDIDALLTEPDVPEVPPMATLKKTVLLYDGPMPAGEKLFMVPGDRPAWAQAADVKITVDGTPPAAGFVIGWDGANPWTDDPDRRGDVTWRLPEQSPTNQISVPLNGHTFKLFSLVDLHRVIVELRGWDSVL